MKDPGAFDFDGDYGEIYDDIATTVIPGYEQLFQATAALLRTRVASDAHLLVVGAGTGREIEAFCAAEQGWAITAVDPSARMIDACARVVRRFGAESRVTLFHGEVADLPTEPLFDAATVLNVMHFLPDDGAKDDLMRAVATRVRPDGCVALFDLHGDPDTPEFAAREQGWVEFIKLRGLRETALDEFRGRLREGIVYVPESRVAEIWRAAGLRLTCRYFGGFHYGGWLLTRART